MLKCPSSTEAIMGGGRDGWLVLGDLARAIWQDCRAKREGEERAREKRWTEDARPRCRSCDHVALPVEGAGGLDTLART